MNDKWDAPDFNRVWSGWGFSAKSYLGTKPALHLAAHHAAFSTSAFCKVQLILRCCGSEVGGVERNGMPLSASQPTTHFFFLQVHSARCN